MHNTGIKKTNHLRTVLGEAVPSNILEADIIGNSLLAAQTTNKANNLNLSESYLVSLGYLW